MKSWNRINWIQWLTLALALFMAFAFIVLYLRSQNTQRGIQHAQHGLQHVERGIQNVQHHQNTALHSIICFVEFREKSTLPPRQKQQALSFWAAALKTAHLPACP